MENIENWELKSSKDNDETYEPIWNKSENSYIALSCDDPWGVRIIKSGWENKYYVIFEDGEMEDYTLHFLTKEEIEEEYKIKL